MIAHNGPSLPSAAEMVACFRDPHKKEELEKRIRNHYVHLRSDVPRPLKMDRLLIEKFSQLMARLRTEEESLVDMLGSFAKGDADAVRSTSAKLTGGIGSGSFGKSR